MNSSFRPPGATDCLRAASLMAAVVFIHLAIQSASGQTPAPIDPRAPKGPPRGGGDAYADMKIWHDDGSWHLTWGDDSSVQGKGKKGVQREWIGIIEALDGKSLKAKTRGLDAGNDAKIVDRVRVVGNQIRFSSSTTGRQDKLEFTTDATQLRFTLMQGATLDNARPIPPTRVFVGAKSENPTTMPFVLELKADGERKRKKK